MASDYHSELDSKLRDISVMYELISSIGTSLDMKAELDRFLQKLLKRFGYSLGAILRRDRESDSFIIVSASGYLKTQDVVGMKCSVNQFGIGELTSNKYPMVRNVLSAEDSKFIIMADILQQTKSFAFIPILFEEEVLGILRLFSFSENAFPEKSMRMIAPLVNRLGTAINHITTVERLQLTEESLRKEKEFTEAALNALADTFLVFDPMSGMPIRWNRKFKEVCGYSDEEIVKMKMPDDWYGQEDLVPAQAAVERILREGYDSTETFLLTKDGRKIPTEYSSSLLKDDEGGNRYIIALGRDISERKKAESEKKNLEAELRQAHKMEAIGTLAGGIAHDFNNILTIILGFSEIAKRELVCGKPVGEEIDGILKAAERASSLVKQILAFSRKSDETREIIDLGLLVKDALRLLRATIPTTIAIKEKIFTDNGDILADPTQIHQVLMNLCTNAAQAMETKGGIMTVELTEVALSCDDLVAEHDLQPGQYVKLAITDTGTGIAPQNIHRIFDPYFTTKMVGKGCGMGLAVVQGIVRNNEGRITVASKPGYGTTFEVFFAKKEPASKQSAQPAALATSSVGVERILLVDDEASIVDIGKRVLENSGYRVTTKTESLEALALFRAQPDAFDLVITDHTMPHLTGEDFCKEIMQISPGVPIILCTGFSAQINQEKAGELGIREFLMKPLNYKKLASIVRQVLDGCPLI